MYNIQIDCLEILKPQYIITEDCTFTIKICRDHQYWQKINYIFPKSNIKEITDNFNRNLEFYIEKNEDTIIIFINYIYLFESVVTKYIYINIDKKDLLYQFNDKNELLCNKIEGMNLYNQQLVIGNSDYVYYMEDQSGLQKVTEINSTNLSEYDISGNIIVKDDYLECSGESSILAKTTLMVEYDKLYKLEMNYFVPNKMGFSSYLGGIRYNTEQKPIGGFCTNLNFPHDEWNKFNDNNLLEDNRVCGSLRYGILDSDYGWGKGINTTTLYKFGCFLNYGDLYKKQITYIKDIKLYVINPQYFRGLHLYKYDTSNKFQKLTYSINSNADGKNFIIKSKFIKLDDNFTHLEITYNSITHTNKIELKFTRIIDYSTDIQNYSLVVLDSQSPQDLEYFIPLNQSDFSITVQTTNDKFLIYINDIFITQINTTNYSINSMSYICGSETDFTNLSHIILDYISIVKSYTYSINQNYDALVLPEIILNQQENQNIITINSNKKIVMLVPIKIKQQQNIYPYKYDFREVGEEYLLDLQYKNYYKKYTQRVSVLDKLYQKVENIENIENFLWRQTTPFYIREQVYANDDYAYTMFVHSLQNITQKLKYVQDKFGEVFDVYNQELYIKRTFYLYLSDLGILQDYLSGIEFNKQIYMLLSLNFFKHIMYYTEFSGLYSCIDKVINDQFLNISSLVQLYIILFRKLRDVNVYKYSSQKKELQFEEFLKNDGYTNIFHKQKIKQREMYKDYIDAQSKKIYIDYKFTKGILSDNIINNSIEQSVTEFLYSSLYRSIIVMYDDFLAKSYNLEESLSIFFEYVKKHYLPQNMDVIFIKQSELNIDIENRKNLISDFSILEYNTFTDFYTKLEFLFNKEKISNGRI